MQKTPWFREGQADVMLNYLPLRNVLTWGIKAMVKKKEKKIKHGQTLLYTPVWGLSLSLSLLPTPFILRLGPIKADLTCLLLMMPFILRVPPGSCRGWTPAKY